MTRVNITIPAMKLKKIDSYCKEKNIPRSKLLTRGAMAIINSQPLPTCVKCKNKSVGKFHVKWYSTELGEQDKILPLCEFHLQRARKETEVEEI